jgi:hypothetical protein
VTRASYSVLLCSSISSFVKGDESRPHGASVRIGEEFGISSQCHFESTGLTVRTELDAVFVSGFDLDHVICKCPSYDSLPSPPLKVLKPFPSQELSWDLVT